MKQLTIALLTLTSMLLGASTCAVAFMLTVVKENNMDLQYLLTQNQVSDCFYYCMCTIIFITGFSSALISAMSFLAWEHRKFNKDK